MIGERNLNIRAAVLLIVGIILVILSILISNLVIKVVFCVVGILLLLASVYDIINIVKRNRSISNINKMNLDNLYGTEMNSEY